MKKLIIFLLMMLPLGVFAPETKIAVVNTQAVVEAMPEFAEMQKQIADMQKKYQDEMKIMEEEYYDKNGTSTYISKDASTFLIFIQAIILIKIQ